MVKTKGISINKIEYLGRVPALISGICPEYYFSSNQSSFKLFSKTNAINFSNANSDLEIMDQNLASLSDENLIELTAKQNHSAFSELVNRYTNKSYSIAYRILTNKDDSEDVVQDSLLKLWNDPGKWNKKYNVKFKTWFYRIVINQCFDLKRKKKYRTHDEFDEKISGKSDTEKEIENISKSELINKYINELPEKQQIAINLCYYEHLTTSEAGEIMGMKPKGVQSLVLRARKNLKTKLRTYYEQKAI